MIQSLDKLHRLSGAAILRADMLGMVSFTTQQADGLETVANVKEFLFQRWVAWLNVARQIFVTVVPRFGSQFFN